MTPSLAAQHSTQSLQAADHFRILMDAMARPGTLQPVGEDVASVASLNAAAVLIVQTMCDHETPVWFDEALAAQDVIDFVRFQCGCPIAKGAASAMFAFFATCPDAETLDRLSIGTPAYPDRSATVIIQTQNLSEHGNIHLTGPGIQTVQSLGISDLSEDFWPWWASNTARFPLGIDVLIAGTSAIVGLPRTVKVREAS